MDTGGETVGALALERAMDRHRAVDAIAATVQRNAAGALDVAIDVAIGVDPPEQHPPMHAADAFIDGGETPRDILVDLGRQRRQAEFDGRRNPRVRAEGRDGIGRQKRLVRRVRGRAKRHKAKRREGCPRGWSQDRAALSG